MNGPFTRSHDFVDNFGYPQVEKSVLVGVLKQRNRGRMSAAQTTIRLHEPGSLIAAVPALLGFNPSDSLIVFTHRGTAGDKLGLVLRADLPSGFWASEMTEALIEPAVLQHATAVTLLLVGGPPDQPGQRSAISPLCARLHAAGISVSHALWTAQVATGARWHCLGEERCTGVVHDPVTSELAPMSPEPGAEVRTTRAELEARLARAPGEVLRRRAELLAQVPRDGSRSPRDLFHHLMATARRGIELDDALLVELCIALERTDVRDAVLIGFSHDERRWLGWLWRTLTTALPGPQCARAACLLAVSAYIEGDGVLAGMAVNRALESEPGNELAQLMAAALRVGMPPSKLARGFSELARDARARIGVA